MARRTGKQAAAKSDEPRRFPPGTPAWKQRDCGLCGAEAGDDCFNLAAATGGALSGRKGASGEVHRVKTTAPRQTTPHEARTRI